MFLEKQMMFWLFTDEFAWFGLQPKSQPQGYRCCRSGTGIFYNLSDAVRQRFAAWYLNRKTQRERSATTVSAGVMEKLSCIFPQSACRGGGEELPVCVFLWCVQHRKSRLLIHPLIISKLTVPIDKSLFLYFHLLSQLAFGASQQALDIGPVAVDGKSGVKNDQHK